jgi:hypothetical protein
MNLPIDTVTLMLSNLGYHLNLNLNLNLNLFPPHSALQLSLLL